MILFGSGSSVFGQKVQNFLNQLKPGEWVDIEGVAQKDYTIILKEIEVVRGEVDSDEWEISGPVSGVLPKEKQIFLLNLPIKFDKDAEFEDDYDVIKSFSDIKPGLYVEMEGVYIQDSVFIANEIGSDKVSDNEVKNIEWSAQVEKVNPESKSIVVLGHTIIFTDETIIKSLMH